MSSDKKLIMVTVVLLTLPLWLSCGGQNEEPAEQAKDTGMLSAFIIDDDFITAGMVLQQLGNQGIGYDSDMGIRIGFPDSHQGRNGHR